MQRSWARLPYSSHEYGGNRLDSIMIGQPISRQDKPICGLGPRPRRMGALAAGLEGFPEHVYGLEGGREKHKPLSNRDAESAIR